MLMSLRNTVVRAVVAASRVPNTAAALPASKPIGVAPVEKAGLDERVESPSPVAVPETSDSAIAKHQP
jgi:hypothetical protein